MAKMYEEYLAEFDPMLTANKAKEIAQDKGINRFNNIEVSEVESLDEKEKTPIELANEIREVQKDANKKIDEVKRNLRDRVSKADMLVKTGRLANKLAAKRKAQLKKAAEARIKKISARATKRVGKLKLRISKQLQKKFTVVTTKGQKKVIGRSLSKFAGPKAGTLLALSIAVANYAYRETMADAGFTCNKKKGRDKDICLQTWRNKALIRKATILTREAGIKCKRAANPGACRREYRAKVNKIKSKIKTDI